MVTADLVRRLDLAPHPEGGWFRETWRSGYLMNTSRGPRPVGTSMLYLLGEGGINRLHRLAWDEVWQRHDGGPLRLIELADGAVRERVLSAETPQLVVRAGTWFGAVPEGWSLVGCTMAPGFHPDDCELGRRGALTADHPGAAETIARLTPERNTP